MQFSHQHLSLSDSKSLQVFRFLLSNQFFKIFSKCTNYKWHHLHLKFRSFFSSLPRSMYLFIFSFSFIFTLWSTVLAKLPSLLYSVCAFHTTFSWWAFTGVFVTASLLRSPGLFSVFWPISTMLYFEWSQFFLRFPTVIIIFPILWRPFQVHQIHLVSPSVTCSTFFFLVFHISSIWWFFIEVWVTTSLILSIRTDFSSAVVYIVSILSLISSTPPQSLFQDFGERSKGTYYNLCAKLSLLLIIIIFHSLQVFNINFNLFSFTEVWVTASLVRSWRLF